MSVKQDTAWLPSERCPYYEAHQAWIRLAKREVPLPLSVIGCRLAEAMRQRLETVPAARPLVDAITQQLPDRSPRCFCGPDLEPPSEPECTLERLSNHCTPSYQELLTAFHLNSTLPEASS